MTHGRIALLPLDDRPPTLLFPQRIAAIAGIDMIVPPRELLGRFLQPGDTAALADWLQAVASDVDALVVAVDMLAFGGLIASRSPCRSLEEALSSVSILERIRHDHPALPILAASVIMRISVTSSNAQVRQHYLNLIRYSELQYLVEEMGRLDLMDELAQLSGVLPRDILDAYLRARKRNHAVNQQMLTYRAQGVVSSLVLVQEDASTAGPHLVEQQALRERARTLGVDQDTWIYPGADEGTQTLLARLINADDPPRFEVRWTSEAGADSVAPFEDRPIRQTAHAHVVAAGGQIDSHDAEIVLWVHTPCTHTEVAHAANELARLTAAGRMVALADVRHPNGADPELMAALRERGVLPQLAAYAGWNTAGNTLGTTIAHVSAWRSALRQGALPGQRAAHQRFLWERYVDDWGYQSVVRPAVEADLRARGIDALHLGRDSAAVESVVRQQLLCWARALWTTGGWSGVAPTLDVRLPWPRTFEVEATVPDTDDCDQGATR